MLSEDPVSILSALKSGLISEEQAKEMVDDVFKWCVDNAVTVADYNPEHLVLRQSSAGSGDYFLAIVDGLGGRHLDWRYYLRNFFGWYSRRKTRNIWKQTASAMFG